MKFKEELVKYPHPNSFILESTSQRPVHYAPCFDEWAHIKSESRFIQVPDWLVKAFDHYISEFAIYIERRESVVSEMYDKIEDLMESESPPIVYRSSPPGENILLMRSIILRDVDSMKHLLSLKNETIRHENMVLIERIGRGRLLCDGMYYSSTLSQAIVSISDQNTIIGRTDWLINALKDAINYINIKYERSRKEYMIVALNLSIIMGLHVQ